MRLKCLLFFLCLKHDRVGALSGLRLDLQSSGNTISNPLEILRERLEEGRTRSGSKADPRVDQLLQRTSTLQSSVNTINSGFKKIEELLEEKRTRSEGKEDTKHISVGSGSGTLHSPSVEKILPARKSTSTWELHAPPGHFITLDFSYFNLTYGEASPKHIFNKLRVLTRISEAELVEEAVLWDSSRAVRSYGNTMVLQYEANQLFNDIGFIAGYKSECRTRLLSNTNEKNLFSHPMYGYENYSPNVNCEWSIESGIYGYRVALTLKAFHVGTRNMSDLLNTSNDKALQEGFQESYCQNDFVEIYTHGVSNGYIDPRPFLQGRICGDSVPKDLTEISAPKITVKFHSGVNGDAAGFAATYKSF